MSKRNCSSCGEFHPSAAYINGATCILCPEEVQERTEYTGPVDARVPGKMPRAQYMAIGTDPAVDQLMQQISEYQAQSAWIKDLEMQ